MSTYLQRAENWINSAEDVDVEAIESTIERFAAKVEQVKVQTTPDATRLDDLTATLDYLNNQLRELHGEPPESAEKRPVKQHPDINSSQPGNKLDTSPLVDHGYRCKNRLSHSEKAAALEKVRALRGIVTAAELRGQP